MVLSKILHFSCLAVRMLDIDGYRIDKAIQVAVEVQVEFPRYMRECARRHGKENFFIACEIVSEKRLSSVYFGRGRQQDMVPRDVFTALSLATSDDQSNCLRILEYSVIDGATFHYGLYRALVIFLGIDGQLALHSGSRLFNLHDMWQEYRTTDDMINANNGLFDPRHMWGVSNHDVFRWPSIRKGSEKVLLGLLITTVLFPGIPLLSWGDEQAFYIVDHTSEDCHFGRHSMADAWMP
jgi:alpha-1,3-glucan synthase